MQASIAQITAKAPAIVEESKKVEEYVISPITDTVTENIYTSQPNTVQEAETEKPTVIEEQTKEVEEVVVPQKTYSIIVASSPNAKNAELAIKELSRKLKADYTIVVGSGRHRISAGDFDNINAANASLAAIKNTFHDAWVLTH
jgi:4-diphosphocytidyl-2C-methyl-D-erythritol kinase